MLPVKLEAGSAIEILFNDEDVRRALMPRSLSGTVKINGFIRDGDGRYFYSIEPWEFNI